MTGVNDHRAYLADESQRDRLIDRLFRAEAPRLASFIRKSVPNQDDVHDLVQETFANFLASAPLARLRTPEAYLRTIARNLMWGKARRRRIRQSMLHVPIEEAYAAGIDAEQEWMLNAGDFIRRYELALSELPGRTRTVFRLHRQDELTYQQIADQLGLTVRGVKYHMRKALIHLDVRISAGG